MKNIASLLGGITLIIIVALQFALLGEKKQDMPTPVIEAEYEPYYPEVTYMLANDSIMDIHRFWGIDTISYYDWEETANALDIPAEIMTIGIYMDYLQNNSSSRYVRNRY